MAGTAPATLKTNTKVEVLEDLQDCYLVSVNEETGYVAKKQISKWPIGSASVSSAFMSVSMTPGETQFTRTPEGPTSLASAFVSPMTAAFAAE